ncbi:NEW3 domain-containing protein, partial [Streptococcus anginosus]|nr:NEW3 domain-containing protein [Streptococcus anginosus]
NRGEAKVKISVSNLGTAAIENPVMAPLWLPRGWSAEPVQIGKLEAGETRTVAIPVTIGDSAVAYDDDIGLDFVVNVEGKVGVNASAIARLEEREGETPAPQQYMTVDFER